jgi:hypothetical protein
MIRGVASWLLAPPWTRCVLCQARGLPGTCPRLCLDCLADPTRGEDAPSGKQNQGTAVPDVRLR